MPMSLAAGRERRQRGAKIEQGGGRALSTHLHANRADGRKGSKGTPELVARDSLVKRLP